MTDDKNKHSIQPFRAIAAGILAVTSIDKVDYPSIVARRDHGISILSDLRGKRIGVIFGTQQEKR